MGDITVENVMTAIRYIESHLSEKLDLDKVADAVHYSKYHLHRMFTKTVGLTVHDYVQRRQLTEAAKLLVFSRKPVMEIALIAGYENQQAFTSIFKSMYKRTPAEYRENEEFYPLQLKYILNLNPSDTEAFAKDIGFVTEEDIPDWMNFVALVVEGFPHLDSQEHLESLKRYISEEQALLMRDKDTVIGAMTFSKKTGSIDFLGVHPQYRHHGIAKAFLDKLMNELLEGGEVSITTFRDGDRADTGQREEYKRLGFAESELLTEFGYPTQRFVFKSDNEAAPHE